jgi:hypothetical protein
MEIKATIRSLKFLWFAMAGALTQIGHGSEGHL